MGLRASGAPVFSQRNTSSSSGYTQNFTPRPPSYLAASARVHGYLTAASSEAPGQVHAGRPAVGVEDLRLQPGEQAQRLRVAFESADVGGDVGERPFAVMAERRVAKIMAQARAIDHIRVASEHGSDLPSDLGDLKRVGEPGAGEIVGARDEDLRLRAEPAQRRRVHDTGAVALEGSARFRLRRLAAQRCSSNAVYPSPAGMRSPLSSDFMGPPLPSPRSGIQFSKGFLGRSRSRRPRNAYNVRDARRVYSRLAGSSLARSAAGSTSAACR